MLQTLAVEGVQTRHLCADPDVTLCHMKSSSPYVRWRIGFMSTWFSIIIDYYIEPTNPRAVTVQPVTTDQRIDAFSNLDLDKIKKRYRFGSQPPLTPPLLECEILTAHPRPKFGARHTFGARYRIV